MPRKRSVSFSLLLLSLLVRSSRSSEAPTREQPAQGRERETTQREKTTPTSTIDAPSKPTFVPLGDRRVPGSTLARSPSHRVYSPLWHHGGAFYALDERGSFTDNEHDISAHVAGAWTRVEALSTPSSASSLVGALSPSPPLWVEGAALLIEVPWPRHVDSTAVWAEVVFGAAAATLWEKSPGARWFREALPLALEAAAEAAEEGEERQQEGRNPRFSLTYLAKDDLARVSAETWLGFSAVVVPHSRHTTPRKEAGFGLAESTNGDDDDNRGPPLLARAFRRRAWESAGLPDPEKLLSVSSPVESGCDPREQGSERRRGDDVVLLVEPSFPSSSPSRLQSSTIANVPDLSAALERAALDLGLRFTTALVTPSTSLASAARIAARSRVVVARTGAALAAVAPLLGPRSGLVELVPPNWEWSGSHLLIYNLTRPLTVPPKGERGRRRRGSESVGDRVLYSSWRPGELPRAPSRARSLEFASRDDEERFGGWSADECAWDAACTEATARAALSADVDAVVDEVAMLSSRLLSCDDFNGN